MNSMLILGVCALAGVVILPRYGLKVKQAVYGKIKR